MPISSWRQRLRPASYNGVRFHVNVGSRASGRRIALHEFPKKNRPYAEDMGRRARRFAVTAYIMGPDYTFDRDDLLRELEAEGPGQLMLPTEMQQDVTTVVVEQYSLSERRERGGIVEFEISFIEQGDVNFVAASSDTQTQTDLAAKKLAAASQTSAEAALIAAGGTP